MEADCQPCHTGLNVSKPSTLDQADNTIVSAAVNDDLSPHHCVLDTSMSPPTNPKEQQDVACQDEDMQCASNQPGQSNAVVDVRENHEDMQPEEHHVVLSPARCVTIQRSRTAYLSTSLTAEG